VDTASSLTLRRIRPHRNERRFYRLEITTDLFGAILLVRNWGRIGTDGRLRFHVFSDTQQAHAALIRLAAIKRRRGYVEAPSNSR